MARQSMSAPDNGALRIQIGTFNCNLQGSSSASPDLTHWLVPTISEKNLSYSTASDSNSDGRAAPDLYAVGFQELLPLSDGFANNEKALEAVGKTDQSIRQAIRPQAALTRSDGKYPPGGGPEDYTLLATAKIVGIVLFVYAREKKSERSASSTSSRIKEIRKATVGTGLLGLMGNKGAAGVRIVLKGASESQPDEVITFVCAHLAAHDHNVPRRNADWRNIVSRLVFTPSSVQPLPSSLLAEKPLQPEEKALDGITERYQMSREIQDEKRKGRALDSISYGIYETSHLFFFGDLNYRVGINVKPLPSLSKKGNEDMMLKKSDVKRKINQEDWKTLAAYDQLTLEHINPGGPRVFHGLVEPSLLTIGHGPTYKYKVDKEARKRAEKGELEPVNSESRVTGTYSELSSKRIASWTDRILWASAGGASSEKGGNTLHGVTVEVFRSIMRYTHSDHKPVTAILRLPVAGGTLPATLRPYPIDPLWWTKQALGQSLDRLLGWSWCIVLLSGGGNLFVGLAILVLAAALGFYGLQGDLHNHLASVLGSRG
ncbi:hypothetical protein CBS101457_006451 [Exobasidium rhododendri]|nr:hypothetical protein CBS101457_006451 [Exobasidium rhododendri]